MFERRAFSPSYDRPPLSFLTHTTTNFAEPRVGEIGLKGERFALCPTQAFILVLYIKDKIDVDKIRNAKFLAF